MEMRKLIGSEKPTRGLVMFDLAIDGKLRGCQI